MFAPNACSSTPIGASAPQGFSVYDGKNTLTDLYRTFWGQSNNITALEKGEEIEFTSRTLRGADHRLHVFDQYTYLRDRIDVFRKEDTTKLRNKCVIVTGTPGIGKTTFLHYYLALQFSKETRVFFLDQTSLYLFDGDAIFLVTSINRVKFGEFQDVPCLLDMDYNASLPYPLLTSDLFLLQAASPNPNNTSWTKQRSNVVMFVLNPPGIEEIIKAFSLRYDDDSFDDKIRVAFRWYGCNMHTLERYLSGDDTMIQQKLQERIRQLDLPTLQKMLSVSPEETHPTSHAIIQTSCDDQPKPDDTRYLQSDTVARSISCLFAFKALYESHGKSLFHMILHLSCLYQNVAKLASAGGNLWELRCHTHIWSGGHFTLFPMTPQKKILHIDESKPMPISIEHMTPVVHDPKKTTCEPGKYCIPITKNKPGFDAYFHSEGLQVALQITVSSEHSITPEAFDILEKVLLMSDAQRYFIFVVPKRNPQSFKCPLPTGTVQKKFKFFVLLLEHDDIVPNNSTGPSNSLVENEDAMDVGIGERNGLLVRSGKRKGDGEGAKDPMRMKRNRQQKDTKVLTPVGGKTRVVRSTTAASSPGPSMRTRASTRAQRGGHS